MASNIISSPQHRWVLLLDLIICVIIFDGAWDSLSAKEYTIVSASVDTSTFNFKVDGKRITFPIPHYRRSEQGPRLPLDDRDVALEFTIMRMGAAVLHVRPLDFPQQKENGHYVLDPSNNVWLGFEGEGRSRVGILTWRYNGHHVGSVAMVTLFLDRFNQLVLEPS